jgi:hypothetical protein
MPRPYWHVDAKWIIGILLAWLLSAALIAVSAWRVTSPDTAIDLATLTVAAAFSPDGLDDPGDMASLRGDMIQQRQTSIDPLGTGIGITRDELDAFSPREARLHLFRQVVEPMYYGEVEPDDDAGMAGLITYGMHTTLRWVAVVLAVLALGLGWALVRFSDRLGRLVSPSVVVLAAAVPHVLAILVILGIASGAGSDAETATPAESGGGQRLGVVLGEIAPIIARHTLPIPGILIAAALLTLLTAGILRHRARRRSNEATISTIHTSTM